jgi:hypothetical protein
MNNKVTLIVFEGVQHRHTKTKKVFDKMLSIGDWNSGVYVAKDYNYVEAMKFELGEMLNYISPTSTHILCCTWDGFIINPKLWSNNWLNYDMIGAPWPNNWNLNHRVGNTGFTLQSKKFLKTALKYKDYYDGTTGGDVFLCQKMYNTFISEGIKYAPVDIASMFSWEHYTEEGIAGPFSSFGFHGWVSGKNETQYYNNYINKHND